MLLSIINKIRYNINTILTTNYKQLIKNMEFGELALFHNQKKGGFNPKTGEIFAPGSSEHRRHEEYLTFLKELETKSEKEPDSIKQIKDVVTAIKKARLNKNSQNDEVQKELLKKNQESALSLIKEVLVAIQEYVAIVEKMGRINYADNDYDVEKMKRTDELRTKKHNALISSLTSTIRYINNTYGNISEEAIDIWEEQLDEKGIEMLDVKRIDLPEKSICPNNVDLNDRKSIAKWAFNIYTHLTKLEDDI